MEKTQASGPRSTPDASRYTGQRIRLARRNAGLTQVQLASKMEVVQSTVSKWERGQDLPSGANLTALSRILGTSPEALMGLEARSEPPIRMAQVIGEVAAGEWLETVERGDLGDVPVVGLPAKYDKVKLRAFRVRGDSMNLIYPNDSIVYIAPLRAVQGSPKSGQIVLVMRHDHGLTEATLKEFTVDNKGERWLWPRSNNPAYQAPVDYKNGGEVEVTGVVVAGLVVH